MQADRNNVAVGAIGKQAGGAKVCHTSLTSRARHIVVMEYQGEIFVYMYPPSFKPRSGILCAEQQCQTESQENNNVMRHISSVVKSGGDGGKQVCVSA